MPKRTRLQVRRRLWRRQGEPKTEIKVKGKWIPVDSLEAAREHARKHGRPGIHVKPV